MAEQTSIPLAGVECERCGFPAVRLDVGERAARIVHANPRVPPCPTPNPAPR